jgi:hypothetical protein
VVKGRGALGQVVAGLGIWRVAMIKDACCWAPSRAPSILDSRVGRGGAIYRHGNLLCIVK